ncbi:cobalamin adenosyltransferase [Pandoraea terrae]|uniref:Cobalamin adenosyltransferase n=1 Tax=Pandoraea terrae TaxID=1537710 RepID=A0A5E4U8N8_9BURK|nr:heme-binding protein [Pandoraea terrae]VVD96365.1 cobalamin adenosyltransferase [Pandoraea terrae]
MSIYVTQHIIDWRAASEAVRGAMQTAERIGIRINVAIVDASGNLVAFLRAPGAFLHSIEIAIDKAYCAAGFSMPTAHLAQVLESQPPAVKACLQLRPRLVTIGGGVPIRFDGSLIGAIGVSGASEEDDIQCATAGIEAMMQLERGA